MRKIIILTLGLALTGASCNFFSDTLGLATGSKGVFRSEDGGRNFVAVNNVNGDEQLNSQSANSLVQDPVRGEVMYLGTSSGIYKTESAGNDWKYILTGIAVADLAIDPRNSQIIFAVGVSGGNGKIIKSTDGGGSWTDMFSEPTGNNLVRSIAIYPPDPRIVVAGLTSGEMIRSADGGSSWQISQDLQDQVVRVRVGPNNHFYTLLRRNGLHKSDNQGLTWRNLTSALTSESFDLPENGISPVTFFHDLAFDQKQPGVVYLATEQGLIRTLTDGAKWTYMNMPVLNSALKVSATSVDPTNSNVIFASVASTLLKTLNAGVTWETKELLTGQEVRTIMVDAESPNVVFLGLGNKK